MIPQLKEIRHVFTLNPLPPQLSPALVEKLVKAEPATIGHFRDWGFMADRAVPRPDFAKTA